MTGSWRVMRQVEADAASPTDPSISARHVARHGISAPPRRLCEQHFSELKGSHGVTLPIHPSEALRIYFGEIVQA
jgi:hypothetical protein